VPLRDDITQPTRHRDNEPVACGGQRAVFRRSHDLPALVTDLCCRPDAGVSMMQRPYADSTALVMPLAPDAELKVGGYFTTEYVSCDGSEDVLAHRPRRCVRRRSACGTRDRLPAMPPLSRGNFDDAAPDEHVTPSPRQAIRPDTGRCRGFARLMPQAVQRMDMAARFVSGCLRDPSLDRQAAAGSTCAGQQVDLPGVDRVPFAPTGKRRAGTTPLMRAGGARGPRRAAPRPGSGAGRANACPGPGATLGVRSGAG
jgi:hypothetical protein